MMTMVEQVAQDPLSPLPRDNSTVGQYETRLLESTIEKITGLLRVGFGEAGAGEAITLFLPPHNCITSDYEPPQYGLVIITSLPSAYLPRFVRAYHIFTMYVFIYCHRT